MTGAMRAVVCDSFAEPLRITEVPIPEPGPQQVLVRVHAAGVCHTDHAIVTGDWGMKPATLPRIPGHEGCGVVSALGADVTEHRVGDKVGIFWLNSACGRCEWCATGREPICPVQVGTGYNVDGTWADYCLVDAAWAIPLPDADLASLAPIMCSGLTAYAGVKNAQVPPGGWLVVSGVGACGRLALQFARASGLRVVAIDVASEKLAIAKELGADLDFDASRRSPANKVLFKTGGGAHAAVVTATASVAYQQAIRMIRRGGRVVMVGIPTDAVGLNVLDTVLRGLTLHGSLIGTRQDLREACDLVHRGLVVPRIQRRSLTDINHVLAELAAGQLDHKMVLDLSEEGGE